MLPAFFATVLFSVSAVSGNRLARWLGGNLANFARLFLATLLLALWAHSFGSGLQGVALPVFFMSGCIGFGLGDLALYQALPRVGSRLTILLVQCLAAPFAALTEWIWLGTTLTPAELLSGAVILTGVGLAVAPREHLHLPTKTLVCGVCFGVLAALGQGWGAVLSRKAYDTAALAGESIDGMTAAYQRILGGVLIAGLPMLWLLLRGRTRDPMRVRSGNGVGPGIWRRSSGWLLVNALSGAVLGVGCYQWALETTPSGIVLPIVATTPLVIIPFAYFIEHDKPGIRSLLGGMLAVIGVIALTLAAR
jgi:drug/metabolite transporter (DMT)-like permease